MIVYGSGKRFGLPDASPFVTKLYILLKMANISFENQMMDFAKAPKGKIPYIEYKGQLIGDSTLIRQILENDFKADFTSGYSIEKLAIGWAVEKMCEEHLYWGIVYDRWMIEENFNKGPREFFDPAPAILRPLIIKNVRKKVKQNLHGAGMGRHTHQEIITMCKKDIDAIATILGNKNFLLGDEPCGFDASVQPMIWGAECPLFKSEIGEYIRAFPKLMAYIKRVKELYFPN